MPTDTHKIAYILKGFPRLSETFIVNEVLQMERLGARLGLFSIKGGEDLSGYTDTTAVNYLPRTGSMSSTTLARWLAANLRPFLPALMRCVARHPRRTASTLAFAVSLARRYGDDGRWKKRFLKDYLLACWIADDILSDGGYRQLHAHFCHDATSVAWMVSRLTALPFSFTAHAKDIYQRSLNPGDLLERKLDAAEFVVTCTQTNVQYLRERTARPGSIHGIYHGLDTSRFQPRATCESGCCHDTASSNTIRLLAIGRHVEKKGFDVLIDACALLRTRGLALHLDLVGERGDATAAILAGIERHGLISSVTLHAPVPQAEMPRFHAAADIFVMPSVIVADGDRDGIPNVMAEAMACGLPVVATGISGIPELVKHGENGLIVAERDAGALASAIAELAGDAALRRRLSGQARQRILAVFDADRTHIALKALFDAVPERRTGDALAFGQARSA